MSPSPTTPGALAIRLGDWARAGRTLALRLAGPLDRAWGRWTGRPTLPPLWLRRHVGPLRHYESAARDMAVFLGARDLVRPGDLVVDLGCGCGAMATALGAAVGPRGAYLGIDVHAPSIAWCQAHWRGDPRFRFARSTMASPYRGGARRDRSEIEEYRVPAADGAAGLILAKSMFTHLLEDQASHYLAEIHRLLAPGRQAVITAFLFADAPAAFPHGAGSVRWRLAARPQAAVAYHRPAFEEMVTDAGLEIRELVPGFWPGSDQPPKGQDVLILSRQR